MWHGIGRNNLNRAGYSFYNIVEELSEYVLPELVKSHRVFDLALVDGNHMFEYVMTDFLMLNRLVKPTGIIVFDDATFPQIDYVIQIALNFFSYELLGYVNGQGRSFRGRVFDSARKGLGKLVRRFPKDRMTQLFSLSIVNPNLLYEETPNFVALQKLPRHYPEEEIEYALYVVEIDEKELGLDVIEICQRLGITESTLEQWRRKYKGYE